MPQAMTSTTEALSPRRAQTLRAAIGAALLGLGLLFGAGLAQPNVLHNAAHDSRHALSFPCH